MRIVNRMMHQKMSSVRYIQYGTFGRDEGVVGRVVHTAGSIAIVLCEE